MIWLFVAGIAADLIWGNFVGKTSLVLLIIYGLVKVIYKYVPKKVDSKIKLKL